MTEEQIWDIIDGIASPDIMAQHEKLLQNDEAYKVQFAQFTNLQQQLLKLDLESPSMRFTENVLDQVLVLKKGAYKNDRTAFFFLVVMGLLAFAAIFLMAQMGFDSNSSINTEGVVSILSNPLLINAFVLINVVLAFVILDRKVLQPYFFKKMK